MNLKYLITPVSTDNGDIKVSATVIFATLRSLTQEAHTLVLPKDENIAVFAITLSDNYIDDISTANEMRTLPLEVSK